MAHDDSTTNIVLDIIIIINTAKSQMQDNKTQKARPCSESTNLRQGQNLNEKWSGIQI